MGFLVPRFGSRQGLRQCEVFCRTAPSRAAKTTFVADRSSDTPFKKLTPRLLCNLFSTAVLCQGPTLSLNRTLTETLPTRIERMRLASLRPAMAAMHDAT